MGEARGWDGERTEKEGTSSVERRRKGKEKEKGRVAILFIRPQPQQFHPRFAVHQPRK